VPNRALSCHGARTEVVAASRGKLGEGDVTGAGGACWSDQAMAELVLARTPDSEELAEGVLRAEEASRPGHSVLLINSVRFYDFKKVRVFSLW
jgi:hypothetical protein